MTPASERTGKRRRDLVYLQAHTLALPWLTRCWLTRCCCCARGLCFISYWVLQKRKLAEETTTGVKPWDNSDIMQALSEIGEIGEGAISESTEDDGGNDIAYDAVYDDQRFGFGADFIKATLGAAKGGVQPKAEYDLDSMVFSCGDIEGEADC